MMTTVHLQRHEQMAELLGIPDGVTQATLVPIAHLLGDELHPARRRPSGARWRSPTTGTGYGTGHRARRHGESA